MRRFSSYGPVDKDIHYYVPREELIQTACRQLIGEDFNKGGHYITIWAPRQRGKTWIMNETLWRLQKDERVNVLKLELETLKTVESKEETCALIGEKLKEYLNLKIEKIPELKRFDEIFKKDLLNKPLILILDEFDSLSEDAIGAIVSVFRNVYNNRRKDPNPSPQKEYLLHGVALIGVRSVLGVENIKGSPFNIQRSLHIPNLTWEEVTAMFRWYEQESGQMVSQEVIERIFYETQGHPGLVSWFGELLTEGYDDYHPDMSRPITLDTFENVYADAIAVLPNNTILNIISKAKQAPYKEMVLELFKTDRKIEFAFDDPCLNFLYMNGVIDREKDARETFVRFSCPFVQKRLFKYFSREFFSYMGKLFEPFEDVKHIITPDDLNIKNLLRRYEKYLWKNREWMLKNAPRRSDLRIYEAVFHFNLYEYLVHFLGSYRTSKVLPEFPTGNGKVDILIHHGGKLYALEIKSYKDEPAFYQAIEQAARYAKYLKLDRIYLIVFVESIPEEIRDKYETDYHNEETAVTVCSVFVATG